MKLTLRPYQQEALQAIWEFEQEGYRRQLIQMATGTGKTIVGLEWLRRAFKSGEATRALWLAHTDHLIWQPIERKRGFFPSLPRHGIVKASKTEYDKPIIFASLPTLYSRAGGDHLDAMLSHGSFSHIVYDETHHMAADNNHDVIQRLFNDNFDVRILGMTATPRRLDNRALIQLQKQSFSYPIKSAVADSNLVLPRVHVAQYDHEFKNNRQFLASRNEDVMLSLASQLYNHWLSVAGTRQTIVFLRLIQQAEYIAAYFNAHGVISEAISSRTNESERIRIMEGYANGDIQCLFNTNVLTEGYDAPATSCVVIARSTDSDALWLQMVGRGLRLWPNKLNCIIIDLDKNKDRYLRIFDGMEGVFEPQEEKPKLTHEEMAMLGFEPGGGGIDYDSDEDREITGIPEEMFIMAGVPFVYRDYLAVAPLGWDNGVTKLIAVVFPGPQDGPQHFVLDISLEFNKETRQKNEVVDVAGVFGSYEDTIRAIIKMHGDKSQRYVSSRSAWRSEAVTEAQLKYLASLGADVTKWRHRSKGDASNEISYLRVRKLLLEKWGKDE